jgi:DNA-binding transcriptional ArsR family regulator
VGIDDPSGTEVLEALASETTREVFAAIHAEARTASELSEAVDTSLQNVKYHIDKLCEADLVEVADTWYSEQGNEMNVYAPTSESLVLFAGPDETATSLRELLTRLVGSIGALAIGGLAVEKLVGGGATYTVGGRPSLPGWLPLIEVGGLLSPGVLFVLGGVVVLLALFLPSLLARS